MSFPGINAEVVYILVSISIHIGMYMDSGHHVCDVLYYSMGTWWYCDDDTITNYSGYPENVYDNLSNEKEKKRGGLLWMDQIGLCKCYK